MRLRGLPYDVSEQDIAGFFAPYTVLEGSIRIGTCTSGQKTGEAVALLRSADEAQCVCSKKTGDFLGTRYIKLQVITNAQYHGFGLVYDLTVTCRPERKGQTVSIAKALTVDTKDRAVKLRGIPFEASTEDLITFFAGFNIV